MVNVTIGYFCLLVEFKGRNKVSTQTWRSCGRALKYYFHFMGHRFVFYYHRHSHLYNLIAHTSNSVAKRQNVELFFFYCAFFLTFAFLSPLNANHSNWGAFFSIFSQLNVNCLLPVFIEREKWIQEGSEFYVIFPRNARCHAIASSDFA